MSASIGIVGCGSIGTEVAAAASRGEIGASLAAVWDIDHDRAVALASSLSPSPAVISPEKMADTCSLIVECAAVAAVQPLVDLCLKRGIDLMTMSIGGLTVETFERFKASGSRLYVPSGAVCGLDGIQAYADHNITSLRLTTRKPPAGLKGAQYIIDRGIDLDNLTGPLTVFHGSPTEAIKHFPKNINVSTALSLASSMNGKIEVNLVADPTVTTNIHEIKLECDLGTISVTVENKPSPTNPKTSALAYLSAVATLKKIYSNVKIGT